MIAIKLTKAEAEDILHVLEESLDRQDIGPDYAERCARIITKLSRPSKPAKRPTTLAEGRRHRPIKRKSNESKIRK